MSENQSASSQQSSKRLKLVLKTSPVSTPVIEPHANGHDNTKDGSSSPPRPSYSPVTPTLSHDKFAAQDKSEPPLIDLPALLPLSLDDNVDAIALRATISLLQMQRQQSLKDIRDLDRLKDVALEDPKGFADELRAGKLKKPHAGEIVFDDVEYDDNDTEEMISADQNPSKFGQLPNAQNITRCPPIEWSKYHITGKPLEDLHEVQKRYPGASPVDLANRTAQRHELSAPYRPFKDKLNQKHDGKGYNG